MTPPLIQHLVDFHHLRQAGPIAVPMHVHHFCQLDVILGGRMNLVTPDGRVAPLKRGEGTIIPPLSLHGFTSTGAVRHATFKFHIHPRYAVLVGQIPCLVHFDREHLMIARSAGQSGQDAGSLGVQRVIAAATMCLIHALEECPRSGADSSSAYPVHDFSKVLDEVIAAPGTYWTVRRMAERCHMSEGHFTKLFMGAFHQTPRQFLLEMRIWRAADHLNRGDSTIKAVAQRIGYGSVHSFTRAFKRATGVSPAAYVKSQEKL